MIAIPILFGLLSDGTGDEEHSSSGPDAFRLVMATLPSFLLFYAWRNGTGFWQFGFVDRDQTPLLYWIYMAVNIVALICILFSR